MSVIKQLWNDPYQTELKTTVSSVKENVIMLNKTIFYAFSGGQESDIDVIKPCFH